MKQSKNLNTNVISNDVKTALRQSYNVVAKPKLTVDWNMNRYFNVTAVNFPDEETEGFDIDTFPISSIVEPLRPTKGVTKALVNQGTVSSGYTKTKAPRFYVGDEDDIYKYWVSPYATNGSGVFPTYSGATSCRPMITYSQAVKSNKIVIKLENTWASPKVYRIYVSPTTGGTPVAIGPSNPPIANDGTITLYYNGTDWVSTKPSVLVTTNIGRIQFYVTSLGPGIKRTGEIMTYRRPSNDPDKFTSPYVATTGANSNLALIAIEAHLEADLTNRLISVSDTFDMSEKSALYPIGTITSNIADIELSNEDGIFNKENVSSPYYGLIDMNAEFNLEYIYTIGSNSYSVQQFKMYAAGSWGNDDAAGTVQVSLEDYSKFLKEIKPRPMMLEKKTSGRIIWQLLDSVGFVDYAFSALDLETETIIPVFWTTGEETVWEVLDSIAKATQTAIYFDAYGVLQVLTRAEAFRDGAPVDWNLLGEKSGNNLPDIISWRASDTLEANKISVTYRTAKWKTNRLGKVAMSKVWAPDNDTLALRSSQLITDITNSSTHIFINKNDISYWPYKSKVQIDAELIEYEGKQFVYFTYTENVDSAGNVTYSDEQRNVTNIVDEDQFNKINNKTPKRYRSKNFYTGGLKIINRAMWNTNQNNHPVDISGYTSQESISMGGGVYAGSLNPPGLKHKKSESLLNITTPSNHKNDADMFWAHRGQSSSSSYTSYGTRLMFNQDGSSSTQRAGLALQLDGSLNGYYIEITPSSKMDEASRKIKNEVSILYGAGDKKVISEGIATAIGVGIWYEVDVFVRDTGGQQKISVWLNGQMVAEGTTTTETKAGASGKFGFFARGRTNVDFEYLYAINDANLRQPPNDYGFFDLKYGGVRGNAWQREYVWELRTRWKRIRKGKWVKAGTYKYNNYVFDEFGPYVHEVREFDVKFDPSPVRYSYLFSTNEWYSAILEYVPRPHGARFTVANVSRNNAILHGEDRLLYAGTEETVNQRFLVLGNNLEISPDETVERKNNIAIRRRGEVVVELNSDWIQTEGMAIRLAEWMRKHWSESVDEVSVEIFGNPLIEIGDMVDVLYTTQNASPSTHKYFVVGTSSSFVDGGIETTLTLRRNRPANV